MKNVKLMVTREQLEQKYTQYSTPELLEVLEREADYTELAVNVARAELAKRNITQAELNTFEADKAHEAVEKRERALEELTLGYKALFYLLFIPIILMTIRLNYRQNGNRLKLWQSYYYSITGFIFLFGGVLAAVAIKTPHVTPMVILSGALGFVIAIVLERPVVNRPVIKKIEAATPQT